MHPLLPSLVALPLSLASAAAQFPAPQTLFDGRSLDGWQGDTSFWHVEDGLLTGESTPQHLAQRTNYLVWTGAPVGDFELTLEFKLVGGNSGVQFRSRGAGPFDVAGYQADLEDGPNWSGCLYEQEGRGVVATRGQLVSYDEQGERTQIAFGDAGEILGHVRVHDWNTYRIRAVGPRIDLAINGWNTCTLIDRDPAHAAGTGNLALQLHQGMPMKVQFRNLQLVRLDGPAGAQPAAAPPAVAGSAPRAAADGPRWIWSSLPARENRDAWLGTRFELAARARKVRIAGSVDNSFTAEIDGELVLAGDEWEHPVKDEIEAGLAAGAHELVVHASNQGDAAGAWMELVCELEDGTTRRILSDGSWRASDEPPPNGWLSAADAPAGTHSAAVVGPLGCAPWGAQPAARDYMASSTLDPAEIHVPPGFTIERVYCVPKALEGSWVALAFDAKGRVYASDQYGALYRLTLAPDHASTSQVERVPIELGEAHGLLWAFDSLYAVVTHGEKFASGLYRASDSNGDDQLDRVELLSKFEERGGEHGPHAIVLGPDAQSLYVLAGNHTSLPAPLSNSRLAPFWGEDDLLPRCEDPGGHAVGIRAPGGWLARTDRDGKQWELVAAGMRNAYDFDFDAEGEAFTYDSDMEWDVGLPWYRPTRVLHLAPGTEFGWRSGSGVFPASVPDSWPPAVDVGLGSPTGVAFARRSNFPAPWHERLFVGDWAYGRILSVELDPQGSSWGGSWQVFASGRPLPVTDLLFGPDGALYFAIGGRRTSSALYRVRWSGEAQATNTVRPAGREARERRRALEALQLGSAALPRREIESALASEDPFLCGAARSVLEKRPLASWSGELDRELAPRARVQLLLALARADGRNSAERLYRELDALPIERWSAEERAQAVRAWQMAFARAGAPPEPLARRVRQRFLKLLPSGELESDRALIEMLVVLGEPAVVPLALERAEQENLSTRSLAYGWPLRAAKNGWNESLRRRFFTWLNRSTLLWAGGASFAGYLRHLRAKAIETLSAEERRALGTLLDEPVPPRPAGAPTEIVARYNDAELAPWLADVRRGRDFESGKRAFTHARCFECHRIANEGGNRGPDLTGAGARFSERDLLEAVLHPSAAVADQYAETQVLTKDERLIVGRVEREDARTLVLHVAAPVEQDVEIAKDEVAERSLSKLSPMPQGLLDVLQREEVLDLFAYVLSGARSDAPAFR